MLTTQKNTFISVNDGAILYYIEGTCLSTDEKPTNVANGSILLEMDTSKLYMFDAANSTWRVW